jgi:hypothetical protein
VVANIVPLVPQRTEAEAWEMVEAHESTIAELVGAEIKRKKTFGERVPSHVREEMIATQTLRAFELAQSTTGDFEHHLRFVLSRELRRGNGRSPDLMDRSFGIDLDDDQMSEGKREKLLKKEMAPAEPEFESESTPAVRPPDLASCIDQLPGKYRVVARLTFVEHRPLWYVAWKTKRSPLWLKRHITVLRKILEPFL